MNASALLTSTAPRWLVMARPWGTWHRYLLYQTLDLGEARQTKATAQFLLDGLFPQQCWLVSLYLLAEVS